MSDGCVFREVDDGLEFVGDFEGLYAKDGDPWDQSGTSGPMARYYRASRHRLAASLTGHLIGHGERLEVGCGHGHVLPILAEAVGGEWVGLDVSSSAIARARWMHPEYRFIVGDVAGDLPARVGVARYDAVVLCQVLWYVLDRIDQAVLNCRRLLDAGGVLVVSQAFLAGPQRYGADIANGFHGTLALFAERYPFLRLIEAQFDDTDEHCHRDGLLVFRSVP